MSTNLGPYFKTKTLSPFYIDLGVRGSILVLPR